MTIATAESLMNRANEARQSLLAFNAITLEHAEAVVEAAELSRCPVILAVSSNAVRFHGRLGPFADACHRLAHECNQPVALHLDHIENLELVRMAAPAGFSSVMFDASQLSYHENCVLTSEAARLAHADGLWVESELGEVGGKDGRHSATARTDPNEAVRFVARTGIDALAVAVGTSHAMAERTARVDVDLIERLRNKVRVPLVLHGSSGLADESLGAAARAGIVKINVGTRLNVAWSSAVRARVNSDTIVDPRPVLADARVAMVDAMITILRTLGNQYWKGRPS